MCLHSLSGAAEDCIEEEEKRREKKERKAWAVRLGCPAAQVVGAGRGVRISLAPAGFSLPVVPVGFGSTYSVVGGCFGARVRPTRCVSRFLPPIFIIAQFTALCQVFHLFFCCRFSQAQPVFWDWSLVPQSSRLLRSAAERAVIPIAFHFGGVDRPLGYLPPRPTHPPAHEKSRSL